VIARRAGEALLLISQPEHAQLAARVMERCGPLAARPHRAEILRAIAHHDDGWLELDGAPIVDAASGELADFLGVPLAMKQGVWDRCLERLAGEPYVAALVAHHAWTVYGRFRGQAEWEAFFARMAGRRDELLRGNGRTPGELEQDYPFLRLGDLVSLAFCTGDPAEQRFAEWTVRGEGERVTVTPDAFDGAAVVRMEIEAREIPRRRYATDVELREAVAAAPLRTLRGQVGSGR